MNGLARRDGESIADHVQRLLVDPLVQGSTDAEVARLAGVTPKRARELRHDFEMLAFARELRSHLIRPDGETLHDFMRAAFVAYGLRHCDAGRCTHAVCARSRARDAEQVRTHASARPTHDTRHQGHAGRPAFSGARPLDQSRGAPGTRNPGGASARFDGGGDGHTGR